MGSMAEKMTKLVQGGTKYYEDKVSISEGGSMNSFGVPLSVDRLNDIEKVEGVELASASVTMTLDKEMSTVSMGPPALLMGSDLRGDEIEQKKWQVGFSKGRALKADERGKATVGVDLVKKLNAEVGREITVRDRNFEVVGILEKTFTIPDTTVVISMADAQEIYYGELPEMVKNKLVPGKMANSMVAYAKPGVDPNELAKKIENEVKNIKAMGPETFEKQVTSAVAIFSSIVVGIAMISLLVGGLSVINTMTMSISERTREIGIRKAIGASNGKIDRKSVV